MFYFNNKEATITDVEYTPISDAFSVLKNRGYCFLQNVIDIPFNFSNFCDLSEAKIKTVLEFSPLTKEHSIVKEHFLKSKIFNELKKTCDHSFISDVDLRIFKNSSGTHLHKDSDIFYDSVFDYDVFVCWTPLTDTTFTTGTLAIVDNFIDEDNRKECLLRKLALQKKYKNVLPCSTEKGDFNFVPNSKVYDKEKDIWATYGSRFFAKKLKIGDAVIFTKEVLHGALDSVEGIRASLDFRIAAIPRNKNNILYGIINER